jgi:hypothetical protein
MTVRQVARRVAVEPLRVDVSEEDSIPFRSIARDARGFRITDASISVTTAGLNTHGIWAGPTSVPVTGGTGSITPALTGVARPELNPLAPQIPVVTLDLQMNIRQADTIVAGSAGSAVSVTGIAFDSTGQPAVGRLVVFSVNSGAVPTSAQVNSVGNFAQTWTLPTIADHYTLTGVLVGSALDPFDHTVVRRSVTVNPDVPSETRTTVTITNATLAANATATLTVTVRDRFNNLVKTAVPTDFVTSANAGGGTFSGAACTAGVCTVTYTAKATPGADVIHVRINGADVLGSPINIVVQ